MPSFFFPQGFMTAMLQQFSRKYMLPIDTLSFKFELLNFTSHTEIEERSEDGAYVYGFFMECGRVILDSLLLEDALPGEKQV